MKQLLGCSFLLLLIGMSPRVSGQGILTLDSTVLSVDTIYTGLNIPWEIKWGPDNTIWTTERQGIVSRIDPANGSKKVILDISATNGGPVYQYQEAGLLGMALHPDFVDSPFVYMVYDYQDSAPVIKEKLVRYEYRIDTLVNPVVFINTVHASRMHNGSRLQITPDHYLFMTSGDSGDSTLPQNINSINGKILRFNMDGSIPADNPYGSAVWTLGHRNPQGLLMAPNGILYSSEHGPTTDDEINIIEKGRNYGWPYVRGYCDLPGETTICTDSNIHEPIVAWTPTIAPSDLIWYNHPDIPEWRNTILMTVLKNKELIRFQLDSTGKSVTNQTIYLANVVGRLRDILQAPDGSLYLATNGPDAANSQPGTHCIVRLQNKNYTGVPQVADDFVWNVYPNPASSKPIVTANFNRPTDCSVTVYDMQGKQLLHLDFRTVDHINANLAIGYAAGIYNVQLRVGERVYSKKMVVE